MRNVKTRLELLAPAKNVEGGITAIDCGADAVYIGAPKFGARVAAGNSLKDIEELTLYAHKFYAKVYVTVNTILYDKELEEVQQLIHSLYNIGVDAVIFQDMSLLKMDLPPIPLYASTQTHNYEKERIKFLNDIGIQRIILARELSLKQLKEIKNITSCELEYFVHGALCVCMSSQCYLSFSQSGRSANRGECSQPCRMKYSLIDSKGKTIVKDRHLLSLKDLNVSAHLDELIDAGITSFKIEGRLKDISYVKNITSYYRQLLDNIIDSNPTLEKSSSGHIEIPFEPDPQKTFNRGYTEYFLMKGKENKANIYSPKSLGKYLGKVKKLQGNKFLLDKNLKVSNGDGLCFFNSEMELTGFSINKCENNWIFFDKNLKIEEGTEIYRNHDSHFQKQLKQPCKRKINSFITVENDSSDIIFTIKDEDNNSALYKTKIPNEAAEDKEKFSNTIKKQLSKSGDTVFSVKEVIVNLAEIFFMPVSQLNEIRRQLLDNLLSKRISNYKRLLQPALNNSVPYPYSKLDYRLNVSNKLAETFYSEHNANVEQQAFEKSSKNDMPYLMRCKYCIKNELSMCNDNKDYSEPFYVVQNKNKYQLEFNCSECEMYIKQVK